MPDRVNKAFDTGHLWHPYSAIGAQNHLITSAEGVHITMEDGTRLIDGMSSWWSAIHGYRHPEIEAAVRGQLETLPHVMFGGLTHEKAITLGERLLEIVPANLARIFYADSGSVAVEVAVKMALQYWQGRGKPGKKRMLALRGAYHGDTFGAMALCDPAGGMHHRFAGNLAGHLFAPRPKAAFGTPCGADEKLALEEIFDRHHQSLAAFFVEPVLQGAGGMWNYSADYLAQAERLCRAHGVLLIADEIATGFGRTGKLFASEHAGIQPDILCLGKALTGGTLTLAATLCTEEVAAGVCAENTPLMHGPTFMANPLACAAALASVDLLLGGDWQKRVARIEGELGSGLAPLAENEKVRDVRVFGATGTVELREPADVEKLQKRLMEDGVWLRPFANLLYTMPPYIADSEQIGKITGAMRGCLSA